MERNLKTQVENYALSDYTLQFVPAAAASLPQAADLLTQVSPGS